MTVRKPIVLASGQRQQIQPGDCLLLEACTTGNASLQCPHGTAPSSPNNGDLWTTTAGLFARVNGATVGPLGIGYTDEQVRDIIGAALVAGSNVTITVNDAGDTITIASTGGGGGGATAPTLRSSDIQSSSASSYNVNFPTGAAAGDVCVLFIGHGFALSAPPGWKTIDLQSGTNWNGGCFARMLVASDISTGYVTVGASGSFNGVIAIACFTGFAGRDFATKAFRNSSGFGTRTYPTDDWDITTTDYVFYFGSDRANNTVTCDQGSSLQTISASDASGALYGGVPASNGAITTTWTYSGGGGTGDYQIIVAFRGI